MNSCIIVDDLASLNLLYSYFERMGLYNNYYNYNTYIVTLKNYGRMYFLIREQNSEPLAYYREEGKDNKYHFNKYISKFGEYVVYKNFGEFIEKQVRENRGRKVSKVK